LSDDDDDAAGGDPDDAASAPVPRTVTGGRIAALARAHGPDAIGRLVAAMQSKDARIGFAAAKELLDRGFGKAVAMPAADRPLDGFSDAELEAALTMLDAIARGGEPG
jgi:hypothetical protein